MKQKRKLKNTPFEIGTIVYCPNRYPQDIQKDLCERTIMGYANNGFILNHPVIWSKDRIRGTKEDGYPADEIMFSHKNRNGKTDQSQVPKGMFIP